MLDNLRELILMIIALGAVVSSLVTVFALAGYLTGNTGALQIIYITAPAALITLAVTLYCKEGWMRLLSWFV